MEILKIFGKVVVTFAVIDMFIVFMTMAQIAQGQDTPHIPFWDKQIEVIVNIIK